MEAPTPEAACREVILDWPSMVELAKFATDRHGYCNSDGGFGITYPEDLDEYQRVVEGMEISAGNVLVFGYSRLPDEYELLVKESTYLLVLEKVLTEAGYAHEAEIVAGLCQMLN